MKITTCCTDDSEVPLGLAASAALIPGGIIPAAINAAVLPRKLRRVNLLIASLPSSR